MAAWIIRQRGHSVHLFESDELMRQTSSASTKLLHGGLRYLEQGDLRLVHESLHERAWWLKHAPHLTRTIEILLPIYRSTPRSRAELGLALTAYDVLAGSSGLGRHRWWPVRRLPPAATQLKQSSLLGAFSYVDAQMDDRMLGLWAADQARATGVAITEGSPVELLLVDGGIVIHGETSNWDAIVNATGPWAARLLQCSGIASETRLDLVRGSHLLVRRKLGSGFAMQLATDQRLVFALPYQGRTLVGTTEQRQTLAEPVACSAAEREYLVNAFNNFFTDPMDDADVESTFAGVRPLVDSGRAAHAQRRGARIETSGRVVTIFGGKWTTARTLAMKVADAVDRIL